MSIERGVKTGYVAANAVNPVGDNFVTGVWKGVGIYCSERHSNARKVTIDAKVKRVDDELFAKYHP